MALRKKQDNIVVNLKRQEWDDVLNCISFTETNYPRGDATQFLKAVEKLRVKFWRSYERQKKALS